MVFLHINNLCSLALAFYLPTIYSLEPSIKIENIFLQYIMKEIILRHERDATTYPLQEGTRLYN